MNPGEAMSRWRLPTQDRRDADNRSPFVDHVGQVSLSDGLVRDVGRWKTRCGAVKISLALFELVDLIADSGLEVQARLTGTVAIVRSIFRRDIAGPYEMEHQYRFRGVCGIPGWQVAEAAALAEQASAWLAGVRTSAAPG
jgi:hypothetical protein